MDPLADRDACEGKVNSSPRRVVNLGQGDETKHDIAFSGGLDATDTVDKYHARLRAALEAKLASP